MINVENGGSEEASKDARDRSGYENTSETKSDLILVVADQHEAHAGFVCRTFLYHRVKAKAAD